MSNKVNGRDQASGPNINLPPNKNFCIERGDDDTILTGDDDWPLRKIWQYGFI